jgi:uncharacterized protein YdaU (DUF1376 family)
MCIRLQGAFHHYPRGGCLNHSPSQPYSGGPTNFYRRFPGDYLRDTQHLTLAQHGIYNLLLDTLYSTEKPIRSREDAYRIARCDNTQSVSDCNKIIEEFFTENQSGISNKRVKEEIVHAQNRGKSARMNGLNGGRPKTQTEPSGLAKPNPEKSSPDTRYQIPNKEESNTPAVLVPEENAFQTFWKAYPKKVNERQAFRAWVQCTGIHDHLEEILTVIMRYETSGMWDDPTKIPNAENFIRDKRWRDEVPQGGKNRDRAIEQSIRESVQIAREYGIGENDLEVGDASRPALQPARAVLTRRKENLH